MPEEFEGDLAGAVFWGADLRGALFRDVDLTGATITHASLVDVGIDALVERLVVNGVDVTAYVNERDPWYPLRTMLRPPDRDAMCATWAALGQEWATTHELAAALGPDAAFVSVGGEWSLASTLRHLVFATDKWFTVPILGEPFHPLGLPNSGSVDFGWPGLDPDTDPTFDEVLAARKALVERFGDYLASVPESELTRSVDVLENGPHPLIECLYVAFEEEFWHNRYARRDLTALAAGGD